MAKINDITSRLTSKPDYIRAGQHLFNVLFEVRPDVANEIRGTAADPFYDDKKIPACWERIITLW